MTSVTLTPGAVVRLTRDVRTIPAGTLVMIHSISKGDRANDAPVPIIDVPGKGRFVVAFDDLELADAVLPTPERTGPPLADTLPPPAVIPDPAPPVVDWCETPEDAMAAKRETAAQTQPRSAPNDRETAPSATPTAIVAPAPLPAPLTASAPLGSVDDEMAASLTALRRALAAAAIKGEGVGRLEWLVSAVGHIEWTARVMAEGGA